MTFTTRTTRLPDGNYICYMDSGPPVGYSTSYTTIVMLHGTAFNAHVFDPLHELASQYNLRIFAVQRRGYEGSSNYSDTELEDLRNGNPVFLDRLAILLGHLINHLILEYQLPEPNQEGTEGGVVLLAWSMGCPTAIPILSDFNLFGSEQYDVLSRYLTNLVLYDPPSSAFGFDSPPGVPTVMLGKDLKEHFENFKPFVSSYFDHPPNWDGDPTQFDLRPRTGRATTDSWTPQQWEEIYQIQPAIESESHIIRGPIQASVRDFAQRALFDDKCIATTFPKVKVIHFVCWKSNRLSLWGYYCVKNRYLEQEANHGVVRPLSFRVIKEANHFWHWDEPHEFLRHLADAVRGKVQTE